MLSGIELDLINSSDSLEEDSNYFDESYYSLVEATYSQNGKINLISINSPVTGELLIYVDGKKYGALFLGEGVQNIPLQIDFKKQLTIYFSPDESKETKISDLKINTF